MIIRLLLFIAVLLCAVVAPTWLLAALAVVYAFRYTAYELIFVAAAIDAFYGTGTHIVPYYTISFVLLLICIEWIKPRISLYN